MKEIIILAEILCLESATKSFNFPISNSVRISFWLKDGNHSTFSEIRLTDTKLEIGKKSIVRIQLLEQEFLKNKIKPDTEFYMGVYPQEVIIGRVIEVGLTVL